MTETIERKDDADLRLLVEVWLRLPECIREKILLLAKGQQEIVKLVWTPKGYEKTVVDGKGGGIEYVVDDQYEKR